MWRIYLHKSGVIERIYYAETDFNQPFEKTMMKCRSGCGACCIAPSISSPLPGMPQGKPANVRCLHLDAAFRCGLFDSPLRPAVCATLQPMAEMCGASRDEALVYLLHLDAETAP